MNDNVVAFISRWRGRYHRRFVVDSCPAARRRQRAWQSFPLRRRQFHRYRTVAAASTGIRWPDAFAHRGAAASGNARSKAARSRHRTQAEIEAGPSLGATLGATLVVAPVWGTRATDRTGKTQMGRPQGRPYVILMTRAVAVDSVMCLLRADGQFRRIRRGDSFRRTFRRSGPLTRPGPWRAE
jgi:hypothetical protein